VETVAPAPIYSSLWSTKTSQCTLRNPGHEPPDDLVRRGDSTLRVDDNRRWMQRSRTRQVRRHGAPRQPWPGQERFSAQVLWGEARCVNCPLGSSKHPKRRPAAALQPGKPAENAAPPTPPPRGVQSATQVFLGFLSCLPAGIRFQGRERRGTQAAVRHAPSSSCWEVLFRVCTQTQIAWRLAKAWRDEPGALIGHVRMSGSGREQSLARPGPGHLRTAHGDSEFRKP
jgi:hypothetical protein